MEQWQVLADSLNLAQLPTVSSLANLALSLSERYDTSEPIQLLDLRNSFYTSSSSQSVPSDQQWSQQKDFAYKAGLFFETFAQFKWNLSEELAEETYETTGINFEPSLELHGQLDSYGTIQYGSWFGASLTIKTVPLDVQLIGAHYRKSISMPEWWATPEEPLPSCFGVSSSSKPVKVELGWQFTYPVCRLSFADFLTWDGPQAGTDDDLKFRLVSLLDGACTAETYGSSFGNDTPWISWSLLENMDQFYEHVPFSCHISFNAPPPQQPFCDIKTDPGCVIGCKPDERNPDCQANPNYQP